MRSQKLWLPALAAAGLVGGGLVVRATTSSERNLIDEQGWKLRQTGEVGASLTKFAADPAVVRSAVWQKPPVSYRIALTFTNHRATDALFQNELGGVRIAPGKACTLRFFARASSDSPADVTLGGEKKTFHCAPEWKEFRLPLTPRTRAGTLVFQLGMLQGAIDLTAIRLYQN